MKENYLKQKKSIPSKVNILLTFSFFFLSQEIGITFTQTESMMEKFTVVKKWHVFSDTSNCISFLPNDEGQPSCDL